MGGVDWTGWAGFGAAFAVFLLSHAVPVRPPVRPWLVARLGACGFTLAYSVLSVAVLVWLIGAAGRAPHVPLWGWAAWQAWVPLVAMLPVCVIIALAVGRPNPFSFGGAGNARFDPARPGIVGWMRHPLLVALAIWAGAHLLANGDLAHVILFGVFAGFALLGQRVIDRRRQREMGARWAALRAGMVRGAVWRRGDALRLAAGVMLYLALLMLHPVVIGVSPLP
ncbi:MAG: NnrU family protein [Paracoccaceae bacterium]|nr:NnrU family protein [Paracoccaceae bacterium]